MTESDWLTSTDPAAMLCWCNSERDYRPSVHPVVTDRQLRLFACACCRQVWHLLTDERSRKAVEVAELFADGDDSKDIDAVWDAAHDACGGYSEINWAAWFALDRRQEVWPSDSLIEVMGLTMENGVTKATQAALLHDIIGNPFRPVTIDPSWLTWNDGAIPVLAQAAYEERVARKCETFKGTGRKTRSTIKPATAKCGFCGGKLIKRTDLEEPGLWWCAKCMAAPKSHEHIDCPDCHGTGTIPTGELDAGRLQVLADALEEAGCQEEVILRHLRGWERCPNEHSWDLPSHQFFDGGSYAVETFCETCNGTGWIPNPGPHVRGCWVLYRLRRMT